jgi:hypothetical protein
MHKNKQRGEKKALGQQRENRYMFSMGSYKRVLHIFINALKTKADV